MATPQTALLKMLSLDVLEEKSELEEDGVEKQTNIGFYKSATTAADTLGDGKKVVVRQMVGGAKGSESTLSRKEEEMINPMCDDMSPSEHN